MNLDANSLLASFVIGSIGLVAFMYGKKQARLPHMIAGVILMAYPYFVPNLWLMSGIAAVVIGLLVLATRLGW